MLKGFYNLTSGMLTQGRHLDVIANNMTNVSTAGYKSDDYTASTFDEVMFSLVGNKDKSQYTDIGNISYILASDQLYTNFKQGQLEDTGLNLNFAIEGEGFFGVQMADGTTAYTRSGCFTLDEEGYLCLSEQGRVVDQDGQPLRVYSDTITADAQGNLFTADGAYLGALGRFGFADRAALTRNAQGLFTSAAAPQADTSVIHQKMVERSNVDMTKEMVEMMSCQRALQSAAQVSKMYDSLMNKATSEVGKL